MCNRVLAMSAWQGWHCGAGGRLIFSRKLIIPSFAPQVA